MKPDHSRPEQFKHRLREDGLPDEIVNGLPDLERWEDPAIDPAHQAQVMAMLRRKNPRFADHARFAVALLRAQVRVVQRGVWLASALSFLLGGLVTAALYASTETIVLALVAPLAVACGIAFIYGPDADPPLEVLLTTATTPRQVLLARLVLVFGFNLALGIVATVLLSGVLSAALGPLLTAWLAPMAFLSALAFAGSVFFADSLAGVMISLCAWFVLCAGYLARTDAQISAVLPDFTASGTQLPLWAAAIALGALGYWMAGLEEHWMRRE